MCDFPLKYRQQILSACCSFSIWFHYNYQHLFLLQRDLVLAHRTTDVASTRSPAQPHLPDGPAHQLDKNYYYSRDLRRSVFSPSIVASNLNQLASHEDSSVSSVSDGTTSVSRHVPGWGHQWTLNQ